MNDWTITAFSHMTLPVHHFTFVTLPIVLLGGTLRTTLCMQWHLQPQRRLKSIWLPCHCTFVVCLSFFWSFAIKRKMQAASIKLHDEPIQIKKPCVHKGHPNLAQKRFFKWPEHWICVQSRKFPWPTSPTVRFHKHSCIGTNTVSPQQFTGGLTLISTQKSV